jgi:hypothetical protein
VNTSNRRLLARFLGAIAIAYVGLAIFFAVNEQYVVAIGNGLTAAICLIVGRIMGSMERGGPSWRLFGMFIAALIGINLLVWTSVF